MFNIISNMLLIITYICNTNKLVLCWINECYQISYKLYNKQYTYFFYTTHGTIKIQNSYIFSLLNYSYNYFNLFI